MKRLWFAILLLIVISATVLADVARPDQRRSKSVKKPVTVDTTMTIKIEREAKEARLIIPRSQLKQLRAQLESIDDGSDDNAAVISQGEFGRLQTIFGGFFLSLAFVFGGIWFSRSRRLPRPLGRIALGAMIVFAGTAVTAIVYGNAGPPPEARSITGKMFSQAMHIYKFGSGRIKLEVSDDDYITMVVPDTTPAPAPAPEE